MKKLLRILALIPLMVAFAAPVFATTTMTSAWYWRDGDRYSLPIYPVTRANVQAKLDLASPTRQLYVQLGPGVMDADSAIWVHGNTTIYGFGKGITTILRSRFTATDPTGEGDIIHSAKYGLHAANKTGAGGFPTDSLANITLQGFTIDGNFSTFASVNPNAPGSMGIQFWFTDGVLLRDLEIKNTLQTAIEMDACRNVLITGISTYKTGQQLNLGSRNAINLNNNAGSIEYTYTWGKNVTISDCKLEEFKDTGIDIIHHSNVAITNVVMACSHDSTYGNYAFESEGSIAGYTRKNISISNVVARGLTGSFYTNNGGVTDLENLTITNCSFEGSATKQSYAAINLSSGGTGDTKSVKISHSIFTNLNSGNNDGSVYSAAFVWAFTNNPAGKISDVTIDDCKFIGTQNTYHANNDGMRIGGALNGFTLTNSYIANAEAHAINVVAGATDTTANVVIDGNTIDGAQTRGIILETAGGLVTGVDVVRNTIKDAEKGSGGSASLQLLTYAAGQKIKNVKLLDNDLVRSPSVTTMQGLQIRQDTGATVDSIWVAGNDTRKASSNPFLVTGTPTNVFWDQPDWTTTASRIGPYSTPLSGGAIRVVDGVTFPLTVAGVQAAANELSNGGVIILPGSTISNWTTLTLYAKTTLQGANVGATILLRSAGATGPAIREKTAGEGNASGAVGIVIRDLAVWGNGSTGNGIDLGNQGGAAFTSNAYLSDVLVRDFVGTGIKLLTNAIHSRDVWSIANTDGLDLVTGGGANHFSGVWCEANTATNLKIGCPYNTFDHVQIEETGAGAPSGSMIDLYHSSADKNLFNGVYVLLNHNVGDIITERTGSEKNVYTSIRVAPNAHTYTNTIYREVWASGTGAVDYISQATDNSNSQKQLFYDLSSNKYTTVVGPDWTFGAKAVVTDSLRVNKGITTAEDIVIDPPGNEVKFTTASSGYAWNSNATGLMNLGARATNNVIVLGNGANVVDVNWPLQVSTRGQFGDSLRANKGLYVGGQFVNKILRGSATLDFDLTAVVSQDLTITVTGAASGDEVALGVPAGSVTADTVFWAWVSSANTVTVRASRIAGTPNPANGTFKVTVIQ